MRRVVAAMSITVTITVTITNRHAGG